MHAYGNYSNEYSYLGIITLFRDYPNMHLLELSLGAKISELTRN